MSTAVRQVLNIEAVKGNLDFGPWEFHTNDIYTEFFGSEIQIAATTLAQIIGGSGPAFTAITEIEYLFIRADQAIQIGLHGVNGQTSGFALDAYQTLQIGRGSINALNIYNTASSTANVIIAIGGS